MKGRHVGTFGNFNPDGVVFSIRQVIVLQRPAQSAGLHAHNRIDLGVEALVTPIDGQRDGKPFESGAPAGQGLVYHKFQEALLFFRAPESVALEDSRCLGPDSFGGGFAYSIHRFPF